MIDFLIKSTFILTLFLGFYQLFLEREKTYRFNRYYLLLSIAISFVIPFLTFEIIKIIPVVENSNYITNSKIPTAFVESNIHENYIDESGKQYKETINYVPYILWCLYVVTTLVLMIRFITNCFKLIAKAKSNPNVKYKNANLVLVDEKTLPHTFLSSVFINFDDYNNRNIEEELYTHELVHVTQKHTLDILFIEFLKVIFWFNPIFIFYKKAIQLNHEFLADDEIVKTYNNIPFYQNLLLQKGSDNQAIYLTSNLNYLSTKKRLIMMTKSTSHKIALLKKIAIIPILAGIVYFFCIEVVAQEKVIHSNSQIKTSDLTDKDKIRDSYYKGVYVKIHDEKANRKNVILYENLSLEDRRKYLNFIPEMRVENEIPEPLFEKMKTKNLAVWINGKVQTKEEISKYKRTDFSYYTYSFVYKNARSKRFPQAYQYSLYTKKYFDENLKNSHLHFGGDTIKIGLASYKSALKNVVKPRTKADTIVWYTKDKEGYNLYINENKIKKTIVIDAGHGGTDLGASIDGFTEKKLAEIISNKIQNMNEKGDVKIHFTRTNDSFVDLNERTRIVNSFQPDLAISLHFNANKNIEANGFEIYISDKTSTSEKSKEIANQLAAAISKATPLNNRGVKFAPFMILKKSECPTLVIELGFLSNEKDRNYVNSEKGQTELARTILNFVSKMK
jgi:N-acetylmuramoyl-L-alanine amidase/beta-lactamase regulating signal transducer with metallopeptidase domain